MQTKNLFPTNGSPPTTLLNPAQHVLGDDEGPSLLLSDSGHFILDHQDKVVSL